MDIYEHDAHDDDDEEDAVFHSLRGDKAIALRRHLKQRPPRVTSAIQTLLTDVGVALVDAEPPEAHVHVHARSYVDTGKPSACTTLKLWLEALRPPCAWINASTEFRNHEQAADAYTCLCAYMCFTNRALYDTLQRDCLSKLQCATRVGVLVDTEWARVSRYKQEALYKRPTFDRMLALVREIKGASFSEQDLARYGAPTSTGALYNDDVVERREYQPAPFNSDDATIDPTLVHVFAPQAVAEQHATGVYHLRVRVLHDALAADTALLGEFFRRMHADGNMHRACCAGPCTV